jgi:hypothetical protein
MDILNLIYIILGILASLVVIWPVAKKARSFLKQKKNTPIILPSTIYSRPDNNFKIFRRQIKINPRKVITFSVLTTLLFICLLLLLVSNVLSVLF